MAAGARVPKRAQATGAEAAKALKEAPKAEAASGGTRRRSVRAMRPERATIPAVAAYESMKEACEGLSGWKPMATRKVRQRIRPALAGRPRAQDADARAVEATARNMEACMPVTAR